MFEGPLQDLIDELSRLPGVGPKSAQRIAFHLLTAETTDINRLIDALGAVQHGVTFCRICSNISREEICRFCADSGRDPGIICVVEEPKDIQVIERTGEYSGRYHVLGGALDPLANIGPKDLSITALLQRVGGVLDDVEGRDIPEVREVILATNFTAEGEATAHVIGQALRAQGLTVTRLARGVPAGSELEYVDLGTIAHALADRLLAEAPEVVDAHLDRWLRRRERYLDA